MWVVLRLASLPPYLLLISLMVLATPSSATFLLDLHRPALLMGMKYLSSMVVALSAP
jgi:hypothetical protein